MSELTALTLLMLIPNMQVPESVCFDPETGFIYVSNIVGEGWGEDHVGFIARLKSDGQVDQLKWRTGTPQTPLSAPKGLCIHKGWLYVADNTRIHRFSLTTEEASTVAVPGAQRINDLATDGVSLWATDTLGGKVYRLSFGLEVLGQIPGVPMINGLTFSKGHLYCVGWEPPDVYELDPTGAKAPRAFGLAQHFTSLDGIEVLEDGSFLVTDFRGNKVSAISADEKTVKDLAESQTSADLGIDRRGRRIFVPRFSANAVAVYSLR